MVKLIFLLIFILPNYAFAQLKLHKISNEVYAIVGPLDQRSAKNLGNNATFGFVVTKQGVVLMDSGGSYKGAKAIHDLIKTITKLPIKYVINLGGQDHRWFGNDYFKKQGATIVASKAAVEDQKSRKVSQFNMMSRLLGDKAMKGTRTVYADRVFDKKMDLEFGGISFKIQNSAHAHTPGDSYVWLPKQKTVFAGDIIYLDRMLSIGPTSNVKNWLVAYEAIAALKPETIVPGHGNVASLEKANKDTYEYLKFLRQGMKKLHDTGKTEEAVSSLDQSKYKYLKNYELLKGRNALKVFIQLEFE